MVHYTLEDAGFERQFLNRQEDFFNEVSFLVPDGILLSDHSFIIRLRDRRLDICLDQLLLCSVCVIDFNHRVLHLRRDGDGLRHQVNV